MTTYEIRTGENHATRKKRARGKFRSRQGRRRRVDDRRDGGPDEGVDDGLVEYSVGCQEFYVVRDPDKLIRLMGPDQVDAVVECLENGIGGEKQIHQQGGCQERHDDAPVVVAKVLYQSCPRAPVGKCRFFLMGDLGHIGRRKVKVLNRRTDAQYGVRPSSRHLVEAIQRR